MAIPTWRTRSGRHGVIIDAVNDFRFLVGGVLGALVIPLLTFVVGLPFLFAVVAGAAVFGGAVVLLQPRQPFERLDGAAIATGQLAAAQAVLSQAYADLDAIDATVKRIPDASLRETLKRLTVEGRQAAADVETAPDRLGAVRRLLTYYVPRTRDIAENYAEIATRSAIKPDQQQRVQTALAHLEEAYGHYRQQSVSNEADALDAELDLLDRSIKQDLEKM